MPLFLAACLFIFVIFADGLVLGVIGLFATTCQKWWVEYFIIGLECIIHDSDDNDYLDDADVDDDDSDDMIIVRDDDSVVNCILKSVSVVLNVVTHW